jgi:hypothetical protein
MQLNLTMAVVCKSAPTAGDRPRRAVRVKGGYAGASR